MNKKTCIVVAGPTAVGKTAMAIELARFFNTSILSFDSRQCYRELNIGVARPSPEELAAAPHFFIASHSVQDQLSAVSFDQFAQQIIREQFQLHDQLILVGGTGLYLRALLEGLDEIPEIPAALRESLYLQFQQHGIKWLQEQVQETDPEFAEKGEMQNPQRMLRALEVVLHTGQSIFSFHQKQQRVLPFEVLKLGLDLPRNELHQRIEYRTQLMMQQGLEAEVRSVSGFFHYNALQTVGYREWIPYLEGMASREAVQQQIVFHTRQYARRQLTWFKRDPEINWMLPEKASVLNWAEQKIGMNNSTN